MDTDWIHHAQRLSIIDKKCFPEKLPYINLEFIYINKNAEVVETTREKLVTKFGSCLSKELLISIIHTHKKNTLHSPHYVLKDTLLFHIPIQPEILPSFLEDSFNTSTFSKTYPIIDDIDLPPSIFIFHQVNTLFFIFSEQDTLAVKQLKSALKSDHYNNNNNNNITKRVRIKLPVPRNTRRISPDESLLL